MRDGAEWMGWDGMGRGLAVEAWLAEVDVGCHCWTCGRGVEVGGVNVGYGGVPASCVLVNIVWVDCERGDVV